MKAIRVASVTAALAVTFAGALMGCSGGAAVATSTPQPAPTALTTETPSPVPAATNTPQPAPTALTTTSPAPAASGPCIPPGAAPDFTLVSPAPNATGVTSPGSVLTSTSQGNPPFTAVLELFPPAGPAIDGGAVAAATPPPNPDPSHVYYTATYPALQSGIPYELLLHVTQYTNLPQACQKTFDLDLGTITAR